MLDLRKRYGVIPTVLAPYEGELSEKCRENGIDCLCTKFYMWQGSKSLKARLKGTVKLLLNRIRYCGKILSLLKDKHFDIIHTNSTVSDIGHFIAKRLGLPHIWNLMEFGRDDYNLHYWLPDFCVRSEYAQADAIAAISASVYESFVNERLLCPADKTRIIYLGLAIPEAYAKRQPGSMINFCVVGGVLPGKNQEGVIRACAKLMAMTDKFTLHIIGSGSQSYINDMQELSRSLGVSEHVKFWGFRYDVNDILRDMDVGLTPSRRESFGRVTVEYMLNYMPVIGTDAGATPEIVIDGETGYIVPLNDPDSMAQAMLKFITNPELIPLMGSKGRERAEKNFSLERNTDEIYSLYQEILSRR